MENRRLDETYLIKGKTEQVYLNEISNLLRNIYSPKSTMTQEGMKEIASKYMTKECVDLLTQKNEDSSKKAKGTFKLKQIEYAYKQHQEDGRSRVVAELQIDLEIRRWDIGLELRLDDDDMIYEIVVW